MGRKKWNIKNVDKDLAAQLSQEYDLNPFLALILVSRGYQDSAALAALRTGEEQLIDPFLISGMKEAAQRIRTAVDQGERIAVYGDFDADGVTATALMATFLESQGGNVITYIPNRETEGYGLNVDAIHSLAQQGVQLLITVDNGISAVEEAKEIAACGMDLIITDHHQPGDALPEALAVIDPHRDSDLPFHDWAGVGVAFKLACAVYDGSGNDLFPFLGDLAAIGTIADIVPLKGENRLLVKRGLKLLNQSERIGIQAFREATNNRERQFTATEIAFMLVPRINAAGRVDSARYALELLTTDDYTYAIQCAGRLCDYNTQRQGLEQEILADIQVQLLANPAWLLDRVLVVDGTAYHNGVIGIVAARLVDLYGKPCVVLNRQPDGIARGSCRSVSGFSIYDALAACQGDLIRFGGHPMAAGLSLQTDHIDGFRRHINAYAKENYPVMPPQVLEIDCRIAPAYLTLELLDDLELLEPYGAENEPPVFGLFHIQLMGITPVGEGRHLRLEFIKGGHSHQMMYFGMTAQNLPFAVGDFVDAAVKISRNIWNGRESVSVQICDLKPSGMDQDCYFREKAMYESFCAGEKLEQSHVAALVPDRADSAAIYRCLLKHKEQGMQIDTVYYALFRQGVTYGKLAVVLDIFEETGLIERKDGLIYILPFQGKVDLEGSRILSELRSRVNYG